MGSPAKETKDELLHVLCTRLFGHIIASARDCTHTHGLYSNSAVPESVFCHLLQHLAENDSNILGLLSGENSAYFMRYFKDSLQALIREQYFQKDAPRTSLPEDFLINHISSSFVEMVLWWIKGGKKERPEQLDRYFQAVTASAFEK